MGALGHERALRLVGFFPPPCSSLIASFLCETTTGVQPDPQLE